MIMESNLNKNNNWAHVADVEVKYIMYFKQKIASQCPRSQQKGFCYSVDIKKYKKMEWNVAVQICCASPQHNVSVKYNLSRRIEEVKMDWLTLCFSLVTKCISLNKNALLFRLSSFHQDLSVLAGNCLKTLGLNPFCDRKRKKKKL